MPTVPRRGMPSRGPSTVGMRDSTPCEDEMSRAAAGRALPCPFFDLPNKKAMMVMCVSAAGCKGQRRERATHPAGGKAEGEKGDVRDRSASQCQARHCEAVLLVVNRKETGRRRSLTHVESRSEKRLRVRERWWCVRCEWLEVGFCCPFQNPQAQRSRATRVQRGEAQSPARPGCCALQSKASPGGRTRESLNDGGEQFS